MRAFIIVMIICFCASVAAQDADTKPRYTLPSVDTSTVEGVPMKCLDVKQWQRVILIASEYQGLYDWRLETLGTLNAYQLNDQGYERIISNYKLQLKMLQDDRTYLQLRLKDEADANIRKRKSFRIESGIKWGIIAVETIVIGILGVKGMTN